METLRADMATVRSDGEDDEQDEQDEQRVVCRANMQKARADMGMVRAAVGPGPVSRVHAGSCSWAPGRTVGQSPDGPLSRISRMSRAMGQSPVGKSPDGPLSRMSRMSRAMGQSPDGPLNRVSRAVRQSAVGIVPKERQRNQRGGGSILRSQGEGSICNSRQLTRQQSSAVRCEYGEVCIR